MVVGKMKLIVVCLTLFLGYPFQINSVCADRFDDVRRGHNPDNRQYEKERNENPSTSSNKHFPLFLGNNKKDKFNIDGLPSESNSNRIPAVDGRNSDEDFFVETDEIDDAIKFGMDSVEKLITVQEPLWYKMGLFLSKDHPASKVSEFGKPNRKALELSRFGFATLEASRKISQSFPKNVSRHFPKFPNLEKSRILEDDCPLKGKPRCPIASKRYRTSDGTCNNLLEPWKGSAMLPMQRFLPQVYEDGIQSIRRSVLGPRLPSAREISIKIHREKDLELHSVTLMFMQWGQFIDHDITSVVKSRSFNGSIPRCCDGGGRRMLPPELTHPSCLPIPVSADDWFFGKFGIRCMEFIRSAPSTRIDCDLGWREQINQVTPFIDASTIYGSDVETSDSLRTFRNGKITYGRNQDAEHLQPPDPPGGELCRAGALTTDCFQPGDGRVAEQPGLTALHTVWIRFHNKVATVLSRHNPHWSDEKVFQETRKIVYSIIQHITYHEFLPILLGREVVQLFELDLVRSGFYEGYDGRTDPAIANSFSAAAFRFGHSMVQNSFIRTDHKHKPILNNVSLHEEMDNFENIWSFGSVDRLLLGFCNQPSQRRDEFICDELTNHLFQPFNAPFGMDLTAINIQRGRDHGIPPYTSWRRPCGLSPVKEWRDLDRIFNVDTVDRFRRVYRHVDDIDLFSGGLAEKPVRGGIVGPTFACIIAQQFLNLRKGDRFWYENGKFQSSFTPAQLQQIRRVTLSSILCQTMEEIETIQPFVFLSADDLQNNRVACESPSMKNFDLSPWIETNFKDIDNRIDFEFGREGTDSFEENNLSVRERKTKVRNRKKNQPSVSKVGKISPSRSPDKPIEVNIKIQYFLPTTTSTTTVPPRKKKKRPTTRPTASNYNSKPIVVTQRPPIIENPNKIGPLYLQTSPQSNSYGSRPDVRPTFIYERPTSSGDYGGSGARPSQIYNRPNIDTYNSNDNRPIQIYNRPISTNQYSANDYRPSQFYDRPSSSVVITSPNSDFDFSSPVKRPVSSYDNDATYYVNRPKPGTYYQSTGQEEYDEVVFESEPFSTSQRPYIYRPSSNYYSYNAFSTQRPQQSSYDNDIPSYFYTQNDRYDKIDDIPKRPNFGSATPNTGFVHDKISKPNKIYSIGHIESLDGDRINDKLDFKTKLVTGDGEQSKYVKISSVRAEAILSSSNAFFNTVLQREGDSDVYAGEGLNDGKTMRVVDIDVAPSDINKNSWLVYNETEDQMPSFHLPNFNPHIACSEEIPKPIKKFEVN